MGTIVSTVIDALKAADIRSDEAYPGGRIPALTGAVAAVRLGRVDRSVRTTAVLVTIMSPADSGGSLCESTALRAVNALQAMGGTCVKDICRFDEMANVFYIEIEAVYFGTALENKWSPGPGYSVLIGVQSIDHVVRFQAERAVDDKTTALSAAVWKFTLEQLLPPGSTEPADPTEPFVLTVTRSDVDETYTGCRWTSVRREDTQRGVSQIRTGTAASRSVMGIL